MRGRRDGGSIAYRGFERGLVGVVGIELKAMLKTRNLLSLLKGENRQKRRILPREVYAKTPEDPVRASPVISQNPVSGQLSGFSDQPGVSR